MTLDEHIHKAEEDAKMAEFDTKWGIGNYFIDRTEALEYAKECRQLAEWLKDYKRLLEQEPTGHWKRISIDKYSEHSKYWYRCNRCGKDNLGNTDWCPNCGARMVEPQESEG